MFDAFCLGVVLAVGQGSPIEQTLPPELPRNVTVPNVAKESPLSMPAFPTPMAMPIRAASANPVVQEIRSMPISADVAGKATVGDGTPTRIPASLPTMTLPGAAPAISGRVPGQPVLMQTPATPATPAPAAQAAPVTTSTGAACTNCGDKKEEAPAAEPPAKGHFMKSIEGTHVGSWMDENNLSISGWAAGSYSATNSRTKSALPLTWNDRSNTFLFQQFWLDFSKNLKTDGKEFDWGWKVAFLAGSDYRYTVVRGLFSDQLRNTNGAVGEPNGIKQNIYGADLPLFYANFWLPDLFEGTEIQVGRVFTPFGYESVMAPSAPLMSRSYAFNWAPPFFHTGVNALVKFSDTVSGTFMVANGNDVFFDGSDEIRFVGSLTKTWNDGDDSLTFGTSVGRGAFNSGRPNFNTTAGLSAETLGRNNINVFDVLYKHKVNDELSLAVEGLYGYQTGVPAGATGNAGNFGGGSGTATWFSVVNYATYKWCDTVSSVVRLENFYDAEGQRTGFEGLYTATTLGFQISLTDSIMLRPEVRYDINNYSNPFGQASYVTTPSQRRNNLFSVGSDLIIKW